MCSQLRSLLVIDGAQLYGSNHVVHVRLDEFYSSVSTSYTTSVRHSQNLRACSMAAAGRERLTATPVQGPVLGAVRISEEHATRNVAAALPKRLPRWPVSSVERPCAGPCLVVGCKSPKSLRNLYCVKHSRCATALSNVIAHHDATRPDDIGSVYKSDPSRYRLRNVRFSVDATLANSWHEVGCTGAWRSTNGQRWSTHSARSTTGVVETAAPNQEANKRHPCCAYSVVRRNSSHIPA